MATAAPRTRAENLAFFARRESEDWREVPIAPGGDVNIPGKGYWYTARGGEPEKS